MTLAFGLLQQCLGKLSSPRSLKSKEALLSGPTIPGTYSFGMQGPQGTFKTLKTSLLPRLQNSIDFSFPFHSVRTKQVPTPQHHLRTSFQYVLSSPVPLFPSSLSLLPMLCISFLPALPFSGLCLDFLIILQHTPAIWFSKLENNIKERGDVFTVKHT